MSNYDFTSNNQTQLENILHKEFDAYSECQSHRQNIIEDIQSLMNCLNKIKQIYSSMKIIENGTFEEYIELEKKMLEIYKQTEFADTFYKAMVLSNSAFEHTMKYLLWQKPNKKTM